MASLAAELAIHERPDLVILDLMPPGKDGYGVFKEIRRDSRSRDILVIMLTARPRPRTELGLEAGADDYLTKPFSPKELMPASGRAQAQRRPPGLGGGHLWAIPLR